jgi:hypothetical protein
MGFRASEKFSPAMPVGSWDCRSAGGYRTRYGKAPAQEAGTIVGKIQVCE